MPRKQPADITTYLWSNICSRAKVSAPSLDKVQEALGVPRGNLQRIKDGEMPTTRTLLGIASALGVDLWELLLPPAQAPNVQAPVGCDLDEAVETISDSLGKLSPTKRGLVLQALALYVEDPSNEKGSLDFVLNSLGGAGDKPAMLRHAS